MPPKPGPGADTARSAGADVWLRTRRPNPTAPRHQWVDAAETWIEAHLHRLNRRCLDNLLGVDHLARLASETILGLAPSPADLDEPDGWTAMLLLGLIGSSVERHAQQQPLTRARRIGAPLPEPPPPGRGLGALRLGQGRPFLDYVEELGEMLGHPPRDTFSTFVELNGPQISAHLGHPSAPIAYRADTVTGAGQYLSFTGHPCELAFLELLKETYVIQAAANVSLTALQDPTLPLCSNRARALAGDVTSCLRAIRAEMLDFVRFREFDVDFFLDEFRQYQCEWFTDRHLRPPSAANDAAAIVRDLVLFDNLLPPSSSFPGFRRHAMGVCSVLVPEQRRQVLDAMARPSIEGRVRRVIEHQGGEDDPATLVARLPWMSSYVDLFNAQRDLSVTHYGLVRRFIIRPQADRRSAGDERDDVTVVSNNRGVTGMDPLGVMVRLDEARRRHVLSGRASDGS